MTQTNQIEVSGPGKTTLDVLTARLAPLHAELQRLNEALLWTLAQFLPAGEAMEQWEDMCDAQGRIVGLQRRMSADMPGQPPSVPQSEGRA